MIPAIDQPIQTFQLIIPQHFIVLVDWWRLISIVWYIDMFSVPSIEEIQLTTHLINGSVAKSSFLPWIQLHLHQCLVSLIVVYHVHTTLTIKCSIVISE